MHALNNLPRVARVIRWCSRFCLLLGALLLAVCAYVGADAYRYQSLQSHHFDRADRVTTGIQEADHTEKCTTEAALGSAIGKLEIPRTGISVVVLQGDDAHTLRLGAGHIPGTAWPCENGNMGIAAHRDTFFRGLRNIRQNDVIRFVTTDGTYLYQVTSTQIVDPMDTEVLDNTAEPTMTLVTCYPFYYIGSAPKRFIVHARLIQPQKRDFVASAAFAAPKD